MNNVLLILADELRADAVGYAGNSIVQTPNIDRLAQQGIVLSQCMITQPTCTPSRASLLTGCYPSAIRSRMVGCTTPDDPRFMPRLFRQAGYRTASIGKIHMAPQRAEPGAIEQALATQGDYFGFTEIDLVNGHGDRCFGPQYDAWLNSHVSDWKERLRNRKRIQPGLDTFTWELPPEVHSSNYIGDKTVVFLEGAGDTPFFLHVAFPDPHYPFVVPEPYASMYNPHDMPHPLPPVHHSHDLPALHQHVYANSPAQALGDQIIGTPPHDYTQITTEDWQQVKATYYGMISLLDAQIGRILDTLEATGLRENTLVIFASDHGDYLGDHGFYGKGLPYDSVLRVPMVLRGPGIPSGKQIDAITSTLDIAPTLLEFAGIPEAEATQGVSMKNMLTADAPPVRQAALTENDDDFVPMRMRTLTTHAWKLTVYANQQHGELFDRINDPQEMINLWNNPDYQPVRQQLTEMLLQEVLCSIDTSNGRKQNPAPMMPKWVAQHP